MDDQLPQTNASATPVATISKSLIPAIVGSVLVTALFVGGGIYAYEKNQNTKSTNDLQAQINTLKSQVAIATATPVATLTPAATTTPASTTAPTATDIQNAQTVANTFMSYMTNAGSATVSVTALATDRSNVLNLFTAAQTAAEKSDFAFLAGTDMTAATSDNQYPAARILGGTNGFSYTVTSFTIGTGTESSGTVTFPVAEVRKTWNGAAYVNSTVTDYVDLVEVSGSWMVKSYYTQNFVASSTSVDASGQQATSLKYSAF